MIKGIPVWIDEDDYIAFGCEPFNGIALTYDQLEQLKREYYNAGSMAATRWANNEVNEYQNLEDYEAQRLASKKETK